MPTYDYRCDGCGHEFEKFQSMSAAVLKKCPQCSKMKLKRLIGSGAGVIFKGSGFYQTDYRSDSYTQSVKKDTQTSETKSKSQNGSSTSGSEKKAEPKKAKKSKDKNTK